MMKWSCGKTTLKLMHNSAASEVWISVCKTFIRMTSVVFMNLCFFRWETIILISMYGIYIIIMK